MSTKVYESYIHSIKNYNEKLSAMFKDTMNIVPNGVIILEKDSKTIKFANKELFRMVGLAN